MKSTETMRLEGERFTGLEHHVWLNEETGIVSKIPSKLGQFWQDMRPEAVERDLAIMDEFGIPAVETRVYGPQTVSFTKEARESVDESRRQAKYVLKQPLIRPSHAMTYADLLHFAAHRWNLLQLVQRREDIKQKHGLGLDLLGGQGFKLVGPALNPRVKTMRADVGNLLVPEESIETNGNWKEHAIKSNGFVAKKSEALLCDTRLMPIGNSDGWRAKVISPVMRKNCEFQDAALWATLEGLDIDPNIIKADQRFDTGFKRFVRKIAKLATPKMVAGAT